MNSTTTALVFLVRAPRSAIVHVSRHGEQTLCGRPVRDSWSAELLEPAGAQDTTTCDACRVWMGPTLTEKRAAAAAEQGAVQLEDETPALAMPERQDDATTLLVVPCSGAKLEEPAPAEKLYRGTLTTMGLAACRVIVSDGPTRGHVGARPMILSALHGLVDPERVLAPYDVRMGDAGSITTQQLADQLRATGARRVVAFTPSAYTAALAAACDLAGLELVAAFAGLRGIGEQRGLLAALRRSGGYAPEHAALLQLETARTAAAHAEAVEEDAARTVPAVSTDATLLERLRMAGFSAERAQEVVDARNALQQELAAIGAAGIPLMGPPPSASCPSENDAGRRTAMRNAGAATARRMAAAMRTLPAAGTPALC